MDDDSIKEFEKEIEVFDDNFKNFYCINCNQPSKLCNCPEPDDDYLL